MYGARPRDQEDAPFARTDGNDSRGGGAREARRGARTHREHRSCLDRYDRLLGQVQATDVHLFLR